MITKQFLKFIFFSLLVFVISMPSSLAAKNPYTQPNNTWIRLAGTVKSVSADSFIMDYGSGVITVEMDDGDRDADGYNLFPGDKVIVNGKIDDDFFELTTIEAGSVYVEKLGTYFFASPVDEEDYNYYYSDVTIPIIVASTSVQGIVTEVDNHEFKIDTALKTVTVDVHNMAYNPLDDKEFREL